MSRGMRRLSGAPWRPSLARSGFCSIRIMRVRILTTCVLFVITAAFLWLASLVGEGLGRSILLTMGTSCGLILIFVAFLAVADVLSALTGSGTEEATPNVPPSAGSGPAPGGMTLGKVEPTRSARRRRAA